jgi:hypothetical protein
MDGQRGSAIAVCVAVFSALLLWLSTDASAQPTVTDLVDEMAARRVQLSSIAGNGSSSGTAITGYLSNETGSAIRLDVNLSRPLFLVNSGSSQNMVATQVYLSDGRYSSDGRRSFVTLAPRGRTAVVLIAYCADFDKDNPGDADRFSLGSMPPRLVPVLEKIRAYAVANPKADVVVAAQAAVWLAQGVTIGKIRERFPVSVADEQLARRFL